jgi:hypothetical protein
VTGNVSLESLAPGQFVEFNSELSKPGKSKGEVAEFKLLSGEPETEIAASRPAANTRDYVSCKVVAKIESIRRNSIALVLAKQDFAPQGKLRIRAAKEAVVSIAEESLARVSEGDLVKKLMFAELNTGDLLVEKVEVELKSKSEATAKESKSKSTSQFAESKYLKYSDKPPTKPRDLRSKYFLLHTDISDRSAQMLLDKLEFMIGLISKYYGRLPGGIIECYVVRDLSLWKNVPLHANGIAKIQQNAGITLSASLGSQRKSVVYSCDDHGVVQHESVHAYCAQTFGSTGPTWYSEGMAEMGQYWKKDNLAVEISPPVINYLTKSKPKKLLEIVAPGQKTGDSWQAYAWRWALCHLLANNPNYSPRFKGLGLNMMSGGKATFESVYGDVAKEISFEYDLFVKHFGNGYRVDRCSWDWKTNPVAISGSRRLNCKVDASQGWQASKLKIHKGKTYEYVCVGEWKTSKSGKSTTGDGSGDGKGKLLAVVYNDYSLSKVIELGQKGEFTAEQDGHLFVRCQDRFTELSDNQGVMTVHFRRSKNEKE